VARLKRCERLEELPHVARGIDRDDFEQGAKLGFARGTKIGAVSQIEAREKIEGDHTS
jgi:hypothetical protein